MRLISVLHRITTLSRFYILVNAFHNYSVPQIQLPHFQRLREKRKRPSMREHNGRSTLSHQHVISETFLHIRRPASKRYENVSQRPDKHSLNEVVEAVSTYTRC